MGDASSPNPTSAHGVIRYCEPDFSVPASERGLFSFPANKSVAEHSLPLHDARNNSELLPGREGLDAHGFTYVKHKSALSESGDPATDWYHGTNVEDIYLPEVVKLVCDLTGAKTAVVNNVAFRRRLADKQADLKYYIKKGDDLDQELARLPKDVTLVYGKEAGLSLEPARIAHIDYTLKGLRNTARYCRKDIAAAADSALKAEDSGSARVPRYAAYSVWRPVRTVKRDPLAVCDIRTVSPAECVASEYRAPSNINKSGEYMMESVAILPPREPEQQKWYWMPEQKDDEVLVIKFSDTMKPSADDEIMGGICGAGGAPHTSPVIEGTENEEPRCSIEARVMAFW